MRLIDADRFKNWIMDRYICFDHTLDDIDAQPTVDAVQVLPSAERKRGRWIHERLPSTTGGSYPVVRCSICSGTIPFDWETRFCPNCGADMRGEEDEID